MVLFSFRFVRGQARPTGIFIRFYISLQQVIIIYTAMKQAISLEHFKHKRPSLGTSGSNGNIPASKELLLSTYYLETAIIILELKRPIPEQ